MTSEGGDDWLEDWVERWLDGSRPRLLGVLRHEGETWRQNHEAVESWRTEELADLTTREAFGRAAEPWEVANVIVFLASDYSSYMTGEVVSVSSQHP